MENFDMVHRFNGDARRTHLAIWNNNCKVYVRYKQMVNTNVYSRVVRIQHVIDSTLTNCSEVKVRLEKNEKEKYLAALSELGYEEKVDMTEFLKRSIWTFPKEE